jgi:two-component system sensor histidine kinase PilS (NtrC family)
MIATAQVLRPAAETAPPPTPEDWRILRGLSFYRLVLVTIELVLFHSHVFGRFFDQWHPTWFYATCVTYALAALLLVFGIVYRTPRIGIQAHIHFAVDVLALTSMTYAVGGVPSGFGMLMFTPAVGCSLVVSPRMALFQAAGATVAVFVEEILRQYPLGYDATPFTQAGILGMMFFLASGAASAVAQRARKSEVLAAKAGSDLADVSRLNESIIEHMQTGVAVVTADGRIRLLNGAAATLLGGSPGQLLPQLAPALADALGDWQVGLGAAGRPVPARPGGEDVIPRFSRLGWGGDAPVMILLDNARAVREQAQQLKLAALGRLSASIAHEIRNPLSAISHAGQLLAETTESSDENQRLLKIIQRHSDRIDKIVQDVLALSRPGTPTPGPIRLRSWLEQAVAQYREGYSGETRPVRFDGVKADLAVQFDASHLQQVLFNLWDNSFQHGARDGRPVTVELVTGTLKVGSPPHLDIRDNGPGIPHELLDQVFEPFFTTASTGTGLGLYLARELCEYNHARLLCQPQERGACFRLVFAPVLSESQRLSA